MRFFENQQLCLIRGQSLEIEIPVTEDGDPADLSSATAEFGLAPSSSSAYTLNLSPTITASTVAAEIGSAQSEQLTGSRYYFSAWVTIAGESTPVARGHISVQSDSRTA